CVRFATAVASGHATLATKRTLLLTWAGLPPAGSRQLCLAHSFDHLVGDGEHAWAHFDVERPRRLKIDDELEPRRLQHWEIRRLAAFRDAAGIRADLPTHLELVGSVAHQPAGGDIAPLRITRRYPLAGGQDRKLHTAAAEETVGSDKESIGTLVRNRGKGSIDLANCGGLEYPELKPDDRGGLL